MKIEQLYTLYLEAGQNISTDSRNVKAGDLFFALKGENFDGNQFAKAAVDAGARLAIVDDPAVHQKLSRQTLLVDNVLKELQALATHHRRQLPVPVIGITGSNGKTTTKELMAAVMKTHYKIHFTRGNLNNHIGVPLTLLQIPLDIEAAIIEMGANHQGEIAALSAITEPSHGLITNIGKAHLEGFGGIEGVKKGKSELYQYLAQNNGTAFINRDERFLSQLAQPVDHQIFYGQSNTPSLEEPAYETVLLQEKPFLKIAFLDKDGTLVDAQTQLFGRHNFQNIMTAVCIGKYFKVPPGKIKYALENYISENNRSQLVDWQKGCQILMDAYNANPSSMLVSLQHFIESDSSREKIAILGDMLELGTDSAVEHERIAHFALEHLGKQKVILVGPHFERIAQKLSIRHFTNTADMRDWFERQNWKDTFFLLKGSRGIRLEQLFTST
ncbi:MAG TPA: UDP-N-acetylmuramoyl-tripeptide--D-alanyl-D-alanine ligase [Saprospiraceae bacterium]|nr:UDP-N-acetylmuramoyl-tripeptide--D-alanyl-D-alanine ligase [Saprospiraceae bacterium]